jgi:hypothetical protein
MTLKSFFSFLVAVYKSFLEACEDPSLRGVIGSVVSVLVGMSLRGLPQPFGQIALVGSFVVGIAWLIYSIRISFAERNEQHILERAVRKFREED